MSTARPLQIVECAPKTGRLTVDDGNLNLIQANLEKARGPDGRPIQELAVFGIAGKFRTGKSFMLSLFVRYLKANPEHMELDDTSFIKQHKKLASEDVFEWKTQSRGVTSGIWFFSEPVVVQKRSPTGGKINVGILLMDTQGLFDLQKHAQCDLRIFGLSLSLASHQILNVQNGIDNQLVDRLQLFSAYANDVSSQVSRLEKGGETKDNTATPYQTLEFMMRDFSDFDTLLDDSNEDAWGTYREECAEKSRTYIANVWEDISHAAGEGSVGVKEALDGTYSDIKCVCVPHPGKRMTHKLWDGAVAELDQEFVVITASYIKGLFAAENLSAKTDRSGDILKVSEFRQRLIDDVSILNETGEEYNVDSTIGLIAQNKVSKADRLAHTSFETKLKELCGDYKNTYVEEKEFHVQLATAKAHALAPFAATMQKCADMQLPTKNDQEIKDIEIALNDWLDKQVKELTERNAALADQILNYLAPYLAVACALWLLDYVSDIACDGWSDTCVSASFMANRIYNIVFLGVLLVLGNAARLHGAAKLATIGPALIGAVIANAVKAQEMLKSVIEGFSAPAKAGTADRKEKKD